MKFESEQLSIRVQDGLKYNAILSEIYFVVYDKFMSYLPFINEINDSSNNFIKTESIKELNNKNIPEKILEIYADNSDFFNKKYSITKEQVSSKPTNEQSGDLILEKIIDDIEILKNPDKTKKRLTPIQPTWAIFQTAKGNPLQLPPGEVNQNKW